MKLILSFVTMVASTIALAGSPQKSPSAKAAPLSVGKLDIKASPSQGDWQRFFIMTDKERTDLWQYHAKQKIKLSDWAWQWRLGWLRSCGFKVRESYCETTLLEGLQDPAMVVRAEAAAQYAHAHAGSGAKNDVAVLTKSYMRPDNFRNGKPLFVCEQILRALQEIGGPDALSAAKRLAAKDPNMKKYWAALTGRTRTNEKPAY